MNKLFIWGVVLLLTHQSRAALHPKGITDIQLKSSLSKSIVIAIIDTGTDIKHKDLQNFIWVNEGESGLDSFGHDKSTNGIDDDNNGFIDDVHGWNFINNTNDVSDHHGHGTHIAGVIKKVFQKHSAISTFSSSARLMILKFYNPNAKDTENIQNTVKAIQYATQMKAQIINYSGGGGSPYQKEYQAIEKARQNNILLVAAAGNNHFNTDSKSYYPANYPLDNIISVAATDQNGDLVHFSNYGENSIDLAAPGKMIYSTLPNNSYGYMSGTSQATAYVTGAAASLMLSKSKITPNEALLGLLNLSRFSKSLKGKTRFPLAMIQPASD